MIEKKVSVSAAEFGSASRIVCYSAGMADKKNGETHPSRSAKKKGKKGSWK